MCPDLKSMSKSRQLEEWRRPGILRGHRWWARGCRLPGGDRKPSTEGHGDSGLAEPLERAAVGKVGRNSLGWAWTCRLGKAKLLQHQVSGKE